MRSLVATILTLTTFATSVSALRIITVLNHCPFTIWPAIFTDLNVGPGGPLGQPNGWQQNPGQNVTFVVPSNWTAGRIWGRRGCDFSLGNDPNSCVSGGCNGGLVCDSHTGTGVPPATLAQFSLGLTGPDFYSVSIVDGFNLPLSITNNQGCPVASCPVDLVPGCPATLKGPTDSRGVVLGCKSACIAGHGDPANNPNCCTGSHNSPQTCPSSGVESYAYFRSHCPRAYAYAFDDPSSLFHCSTQNAATYTVTFCPTS